jgi:hypothetical protein
MNLLVSGIYLKYANYPCSKPMALFGGLGNWLLLMLVGGLTSTILLAVLYSYTEKGIKMNKYLEKGVIFWAFALAGYQSTNILLYMVNVYIPRYPKFNRDIQ